MHYPKHATVPRSFVVFAALLALVAVAACSQPTGAEKVAQQRSEYVATLNSFTVLETPVVPPMEEPMEGEEGEAMADDATADDATAEGEEMDGEMAMDVMPEVQQDVMLDIVLEKQGRSEGLDGVTVDVSQVDAAENEKARFKIYVETGGLVNGSSIQATHVLEDVDYAEGDGFFAEVRQDIPADSRSDYREFNDVAEGG